jgi:predicted GNAT family N-acyltransferase
MSPASEMTVSEVPWTSHRAALRYIRTTVFIDEQQVPQDEEWDEYDEVSAHFLAYDCDEPVACGRLMPSGKVGRMAVLKPYRGAGYGMAILRAIERHARRHSFASLYLHAQSHALGFYERGGYRAYGETFQEANIDHRAMRLDLVHSPARWPTDFVDFSIALANDARRELFVHSPDLARQVFADRDLVDALSAFARRSRYVQLCILVQDTDDLRRRSHPLVELARRMPSRIQLQRLREHPELSSETWLLADRKALVLREARASAGIYRPDDRALARRRWEQFKTLWRASRQDPDLRLLRI